MQPSGAARPAGESTTSSGGPAEGNAPAEEAASPAKRTGWGRCDGSRRRPRACHGVAGGQGAHAPTGSAQAPVGGAKAEPGSAQATAGPAATPLGGEPPLAGPQGPPEPLARRLERLADYVGLSGETRVRFLVLQRRMFVSVVAAQRRRQALEGELRRELLAPQADEARIQELIRRQADLVVEMEQTTARTILQSRRLLGPDQERRYLEVISRLRPRLREQALRRRQQGRSGGPDRPLRPFRRPR